MPFLSNALLLATKQPFSSIGIKCHKTGQIRSVRKKKQNCHRLIPGYITALYEEETHARQQK